MVRPGGEGSRKQHFFKPTKTPTVHQLIDGIQQKRRYSPDLKWQIKIIRLRLYWNFLSERCPQTATAEMSKQLKLLPFYVQTKHVILAVATITGIIEARQKSLAPTEIYDDGRLPTSVMTMLKICRLYSG